LTVANSVEQSEDQPVSDQDAFRIRMLDQVGLIGKYRQSVLKETGRLLTPDEAALEWIERYAAIFGRNNPLP